jgi:DNA/RNA-binding domain of Phe-tRNA-synthetase-like protein
MHFSHSPVIWSHYPELTPGVLFVEGVRADADVDAHVAQLNGIAARRLDAAGSESNLPEIRAWRAVFSRMGLKPTQYRCASESLLRRFKKEGALPRIHPLIDLCNAASLAFAVPVAVFDVAHVAESLEVRPAGGTETYLSFAGETEHPDPGEVVFADARGQAHARRWTHRQSGLSAIRAETASALLVMEAMHETAGVDVRRLVDTLCAAMVQAWNVQPASGILTADSPRFDF